MDWGGRGGVGLQMEHRWDTGSKLHAVNPIYKSDFSYVQTRPYKAHAHAKAHISALVKRRVKKGDMNKGKPLGKIIHKCSEGQA